MSKDPNTIIPDIEEKEIETDLESHPSVAPTVNPETPIDHYKGAKPGTLAKRRPRQSHRRDARPKSEFEQKLISIRRVARMMAGGRRFNFSVVLVAGNRKGMVGVGQGKAADTQLAIEKAFRDAKKNMININMTREMSIPHDVEAKFAASRVKIMPAPGKGILAGGSVRAVLELAGLKAVSAKLLSRSKNGANNAYAAIKALKMLDSTKIREVRKKKEAI